MTNRHERRKWERIPLPVPLFVRGKDSNGEVFSDLTVAQNVGGGGLVFASDRSLAPSAKLTLQVPSVPWLSKLRYIGNRRRLRGRIVRVTCKKDTNLYAFQFSRPLIGTRTES